MEITKRKMIEKAVSNFKHKDIMKDILKEYWSYNIITEKINKVQGITLEELNGIIEMILRNSWRTKASS